MKTNFFFNFLKILSFWNFLKILKSFENFEFFWNVFKFVEISWNFLNLFWNFGKFVEILEKVYLNILISQEIVAWSSLKTRIDLKNHVLTWKKHVLTSGKHSFISAIDGICRALFPKFQQISQNFKTNLKNFMKFII
jgi:hypothetical protein